MSYPHDKPVEPESVQVDSGKLAEVVKRFRRQQQKGSFPGGQLALRRYGKVVLDEAIGHGRGFRPREAYPPLAVQPGMPFPVLSAGKPLAALAIALLEERGLLDVEAPISHIFPAFGRHGKEHITTLDVLTHRSGLLMPDFVGKPHLWGSREAIQTALIETVPTYPRGTLAYHPYEYGWILAEIVQRIDGREFTDFFAEEIASPLKLPALHFGLGGRDINTVAYSYWLGKDKVIVAGVNVAERFEDQNSEQHFSAGNPATAMVCDAASLAAFYDWMLHGQKSPAGRLDIKESTLREYTSRQVMAWDRTIRTFLALGRGFMVGSRLPSTFGWWNTGGCFGHGGGYSSLAFGDYRTGIAAAIVTNGNRGLFDFMKRFLPLVGGLRKACIK